MKKRLRKKLHKGEFQELGFELHFTITPELGEAEQDEVLDAFLSEAVEAHGLTFGGGGYNGRWRGFVALAERGSASEADQEAVEHWLKARPEVEAYEIGRLVDAWYTG